MTFAASQAPLGKGSWRLEVTEGMKTRITNLCLTIPSVRLRLTLPLEPQGEATPGIVKDTVLLTPSRSSSAI